MDKTLLVLKRDERGRVRTPRERRAMLVAEFGRSGLSASKFAQLVGVHYNTFWNWLQEHGLTAGSGKKRARPKPRLVEVCMNHPTEGSSHSPQATVRISLPGGAMIEIKDRSQVSLAADLLKTLA